MTQAAGAGAPDPGRSIGAVLKELQPDFPDLTISKIRFLEAEGLVTPDRRESGRRLFTADDLERLRFVLIAQRDRYWPLKVIKEALDKMDRGVAPDRPTTLPERTERGAAGARTLPSGEDLRRRRSVRLSPRELREQAEIDHPTYAALKAFGLINLDNAGRHSADDVDIARQCAALGSYGLEARHLRLFRVAADREVGITEQILEPIRRRRAANSSSESPEEVQAELLGHTIALHVALVRSALERGR